MIFPFFHSDHFSRRSLVLAGFCLGIAAAVWTFTGIFSLDALLAQEKPSVFKGKTFGHRIAPTPKEAVPEDSEVDSAPLRFRRVYVPQELLPEIPTFGKNYWPIPEKEFNVWLAENSVSESGAALLPKTLYAEKAVYRARLSQNPGNKCFTGTADFRIRRIPEEAIISKTAGNPDVLFWSFPPVSFALNDQLNVRRVGGESPLRRDFNFLPNGGGEAVLNSADFSSAESQESVCDARIEWSQRFVTTENGNLRLNLEWIPATDSQWIFELPPEWVPETPDGLVILERDAENAPAAGSETENREEITPGGVSGSNDASGADGGSEAGGESEADGASEDEASGASPFDGEKDGLEEDFGAAPGLNVWRISFGGRRKASVTFRSRTKPALQEMPVSCTQKNIYQFRKEGVDVFARMNLTPLLNGFRQSLKPVRELNIQLEGNLVPVSIRFNETELTWRSRQENEGLVLTVQLPEAFPETDCQLEITAIANLEPWFAGDENSLRVLPGIHLLNVPRLECRTQIVFFSPLEIKDFTLQNAYLISNHQLPNTPHVQMEFMETSPTAQLQLALARQKNPLMVDLTTAMDFQEHEISAVTEMLVSIKTGESFDVLGFVDRSWTIDSVEVKELPPDGVPAEAASANLLEDWNVDTSPDFVHQTLAEMDPTGELSGKLAADGWDVDSFGILHIQLAHSIRPKHPISIQIRARRLGYSNNYSLTGSQLAPVYFPAYQIGQSWILCGSSSGWNIKFLEPYREQDVLQNVPPKSEPARLPPLPREIPALPGEPNSTLETSGKSESAANPGTGTAPGTGVNPETGATLETGETPGTGVNSETGVRPGTAVKTNFAPRVSEPKKPESFSSVLFPTLVEARKQFPAQMTFKTGTQDFKNVPMLRLEHSAREFSAEVNGFYDITSTPNAVFSIKCDPQGTEVSRLHLMIRPGVLMGITWKFPRNLSGTETRCVERRAAEQVEDLNSTYELWEITFPQPVHDPFVFQLALLMLPSSSQSLNSDAAAPEQTTEQMTEQTTEQTTEQETAGQLNRELAADYLCKNSQERGIWWRKHFPNGLNLPLIDVTDAVKCTGSVTLQNDVTDEILVETQEMIPSILSREETSEILFKTASEDCGLYRYTPHAISNTPRPQLKLQWRNQNIGVQKAWIWKEFCQSQFFTNGTILHSVTFKIENIDAQQLELSIRSPYQSPVEILGIIVNGFQVPFETLVKPETVGTDSGAADSKVADPADSRGNRSSSEHKSSEDSIQNGSSLPKTSSPVSGIPTKGIRVVASSAPGEDFRLVIPFPVWQRENEVIVQWLERKPAWSIFTTLDPPEISTDLLVLQKSWQAWIPENFVPFGEDEVFGKEEPQAGFLEDGTEETDADAEKGAGVRKVQNDSLLLRLFGPFRLGKNIFSSPENLTLTEIESPIPLDSRSLEKLSSFGLDEKTDGQSSHLAILSQERNTHSVVGWNSFTQSKGKAIFVIYGNILEASRWFLLLLVGFLASWVLVPFRLLRVWICGLAGAFCMLVPLTWTPFFSGIFLGMGISFINSSIRRHIRYVSENRKPVIFVKSPSESTHSPGTMKFPLPSTQSPKLVKSPLGPPQSPLESPKSPREVKPSLEPAQSPGSMKSGLDPAQSTKTTKSLEGSSIILSVEPHTDLGASAGSTRKKEEKS